MSYVKVILVTVAVMGVGLAVAWAQDSGAARRDRDRPAVADQRERVSDRERPREDREAERDRPREQPREREAAEEGIPVRIVAMQHQPAEAAFRTLQQLFKSEALEQVREHIAVAVNEPANAVVLVGPEDAIARVERLLRMLDAAAAEQQERQRAREREERMSRGASREEEQARPRLFEQREIPENLQRQLDEMRELRDRMFREFENRPGRQMPGAPLGDPGRGEPEAMGEHGPSLQPLLNPEVRKRLRLTDRQNEQIDRVLERTRAEVMRRRAAGESVAPPHEAALDYIMGILEPEQREVLRDILRKAPTERMDMPGQSPRDGERLRRRGGDDDDEDDDDEDEDDD